jgi:hypothetical protein
MGAKKGYRKMSIRIANSRGIPGTLGCLAHTVHQRRLVFLTSWHVLFAGGAARHDQVWQVLESAGRRDCRRLGRSLRGSRGIVRYRGDDYFVDCAIGEPDLPLEVEGVRASAAPIAPKRGDRVWKTGATTGTTTGVIVDDAYCCSTHPGAAVHSQAHVQAPGQLLIRSEDPARPFSQEGDSGALVLDDDGAAVGLLWGATVAADAVACQIGPVLHALNLRLGPAQA